MNVNDLPKYPEARELEIGDYHLIAPILKAEPLKTADYNFTNIFAWRFAYEYKISTLDGLIITLGKYNDRSFFLPPIGDQKRSADIACKVFEISKRIDRDTFLAVAPRGLTEDLRSRDNIKVIDDRADWDYIHKRNELAELPGQRYHAKKNLIRQFENQYNAKVEELTTTTCVEAMEFSDRWCQQRDCESNEGLAKEKCAIFQMLKYFEVLRLH